MSTGTEMEPDVRCLVCHGALGSPWITGRPDFAGDGAHHDGHTLTMAPGVGIGKGRFLYCGRCRITYRIEGGTASATDAKIE